ncbi:hypothetical protein [Paenibacillus silvae]|uniref:hypothetical protein n=1 Tax=Paenibacillus silvae TaxID=1325358 RepID=UPI002004484F|nr:hypothetical protein [Paenibacillus silvae]MCK6075390.1 hypothetical protein [Paenibacillus silvae]MCK6149777.1 hypothetical protein [Paenibacillus silvae]MCK6268075.1 hypothetical protein [Paenibacillus silvae]
MFIDDLILSESEIEYLDNILNEFGKHQQFRDISSLKTPWTQLMEIEPRDALEPLRVKGILNEQEMEKTEIIIDENENESVKQTKLLVGTIDTKALVICWMVTIYHRSGKTLQPDDLNKMERQSDYYHFPIDIGMDTVKINLIVKDIEDSDYQQGQSDSIYVSFIGELPIKEQNYIMWSVPLQEQSAAVRFFNWLNEHSKPIISKLYAYINIPSDLEKNYREEVYRLVGMYLGELGYIRINQQELFRPESIEYLFPESIIKDCFINETENKKVFQVINGDRIEMHSFQNGIKSLDSKLSYHLNHLQIWIDKKAAKHRILTQKVKTSLINEVIKIVPIIITVILSAYASLKLIFINNSAMKNFPQSKAWFITHISISVISLLVLIFFGVFPQLRLWVFSWDRRIKKYVRRKNREYED